MKINREPNGITLLLSLAVMAVYGTVFSWKISGQEKNITDTTVNHGFLFSAILFRDTPLGERWAQLRPEAVTLFPNLKLKSVHDLHVTIIYIGKEWNDKNFDSLRAYMEVRISDTSYLIPAISAFGKKNHVAAVELKGISANLMNTILAAKDKLNKAGLKKPEAYDRSFRAHVTLAETKDDLPDREQSSELMLFQEWISSRLDLHSMNLRIEPGMSIELMLAGATRPSPVPEYISVEDFLTNQKDGIK